MHVFITDVSLKKNISEGHMRIGSDCDSGKWNIYVAIYSNDIPKIKEDNKGLIRSNPYKQYNGQNKFKKKQKKTNQQ